MDDETKFIRIFGAHQGRVPSPAQLYLRDADFIADLKARLSGLAAADNRARNSGWLIDFSPVQTDELTERSIFRTTLTSPSLGERALTFQVGRDWVEIDGAMESSVRNNTTNLEAALRTAFRRIALRRPAPAAEPAIERASAA